MRVLQINNIDIPGRRFNGHDIQLKLNDLGIEAQNMVFDKLGEDKNTIELGSKSDKILRNQYWRFEEKFSMQCLLFPFGWKILEHEEFKKADVVHYHLIHNMFMSFYSFLELTKQKPSIWSIHDIWALTGHCIINQECEKWKNGCEECPYKEALFSIKHDKAAQMWRLKKDIYSKMDVDIVVASDYMKKKINESPLTNSFKRVHKISFGVDLNNFKPLDSIVCKRNFGIPDDDFVIAFRAIDNGAKGMEYIKEMLSMLKPTRPITLLIVNDKGIFDDYKSNYNIVELDWVDDDERMAMVYGACDLFLMPSIAETFGLMAIEAMASARPVVVFDGTSLPSVTFAPECGVVVKKYDSKGLKEAIEKLMINEEERLYRGNLGRKLAEEHYDVNMYFNNILKLYKEVYRRNNVEHFPFVKKLWG